MSVRPSRQDRCAECGGAVGDAWVSYGQDPRDPQTLIERFGGIVRTGPAEPRPDRPKPSIRDFRYPDDLGVFFHSSCAPRIKLPESLQEEIAGLLAKILVADYKRTVARWAKVEQITLGKGVAPPRMHAYVASIQGRRVFTMAQSDWQRFRSYEGKLIELDLERTPAGSLAESAAAIASLAAECSVHTERVEVWRHSEKDSPRPYNLQKYLVLENLTRSVNLPMFAERASTKDSAELRKYLRDHVFLVKGRPDKGRWELKARSLGRIVFLSV